MSDRTGEKKKKRIVFKNNVKRNSDDEASSSNMEIMNDDHEVKPIPGTSKINKFKKSNPSTKKYYKKSHNTNSGYEVDSFGKINNIIDSIKNQSPSENKQNEYNTKALNKSDTTYKLEKFKKNFLIIFNQVTIKDYKPRKGSDEDVKALKDTFSKFGFETIVHKDLTQEQIFKELRVFETKDFTDYGCVAVVVLTHGSKYGLIRAKDDKYKESKIIKFFKTHNKPKLVTKPKILIIQAYRGHKVYAKSTGVIRMDTVENLEPYTLPVDSDMLILHSTYTGSPSTWDDNNGSWFIQTLCSKIDQLAANLDLESIITEVRHAVEIGPHGDIDTDLQLLVHTSTLIRKLYLRKFGDAPIPCTIEEDAEIHIDSGATIDGDLFTPVLDNGQSTCFLNYYSYIKDCLKYIVEANPNDKKARSYLDESNNYEDGVEFYPQKEKIVEDICSYISELAKDNPDYEYIYMCKCSCDH